MKHILKIALTTFACLFLVFSYGIGIFGFLFPSPMVGMSDNMGLTNAAAMFSMTAYRRNPTDENWIRAMDRQIPAGRHRNVIELFENLDSPGQDNADGFHRQAYVYSLLARGRYDDAINFISYYNRRQALTIANLGRHCFVYFVWAENTSSGISQVDRIRLRAEFLAYAERVEELLEQGRNSNEIEHGSTQHFNVLAFLIWVNDYKAENNLL